MLKYSGFILVPLIFLVFLVACTPVPGPKPDVLDQLDREEIAKSSKPLPKNFPLDVPWFPGFTRINDSGEFGGRRDNGAEYIVPIAWIEVSSIDDLEKAKVFYRKELRKTRYSNISDREVGSEEFQNTQFDIILSQAEYLKFNFIPNYLGVPAVRIEYSKLVIPQNNA